jgi:hypothetical protein
MEVLAGAHAHVIDIRTHYVIVYIKKYVLIYAKLGA